MRRGQGRGAASDVAYRGFDSFPSLLTLAVIEVVLAFPPPERLATHGKGEPRKHKNLTLRCVGQASSSRVPTLPHRAVGADCQLGAVAKHASPTLGFR